jgi:hypothetical protein
MVKQVDEFDTRLRTSRYAADQIIYGKMFHRVYYGIYQFRTVIPYTDPDDKLTTEQIAELRSLDKVAVNFTPRRWYWPWVSVSLWRGNYDLPLDKQDRQILVDAFNRWEQKKQVPKENVDLESLRYYP